MTIRACVAAAAIGAAALVAAVPRGLGDSPQAVAWRAGQQVLAQPSNATAFWSWEYGPAIIISEMYELAGVFSTFGAWPSQLDVYLDAFLANGTGYNVLNNISMPWDYAIGDRIGLFPIAYLSRYQYHNGSAAYAKDWEVAVTVAEQYIWAWPRRLPDSAHTISRDQGWAGQPDVNASFLWCDDQFMGLALLSRLAIAGAPNARAYVDAAAAMQLSFAGYMRDTMTGLFLHGFNYATHETSCCTWGRANGWVMMAHVEVMAAIDAVAPQHPLRPQVLALLQSHAASMAAVQSLPDGRWHQVLNDTSTYLETSSTAMTVYAIATGVTRGWLDAATYGPVVQAGWAGLAAQVAPNGTVAGICVGTGIMPNAAAYNARPTTYAQSQPGLGAVFRAAHAVYNMQQALAQQERE